MNGLHSHAVFCWSKVMNMFRNYEHSVQCKGVCAYVCVCVCPIHVFHFGSAVVLNAQLFKAVTFIEEFSYILSIYQSSCPVLILWQRNLIFTYRSAASSITLNERQSIVTFFCFLLGPCLWHHRPWIAAWDCCLVSVATIMQCGPLYHSHHLSTPGALCMVIFNVYHVRRLSMFNIDHISCYKS
jgi:hypothetical protein